jgi:hypothetical protein
VKQISANIIIRLGGKAKNIFSLNDWMQVNGKRVLAIRIAESKLIYDTSNGAFILKQDDVVMVTTDAIQKYASAAQEITSNNKSVDITIEVPAAVNIQKASNANDKSETQDEVGFFSSLAEAFKLMIFAVPLSFVAVFVAFGLDKCTGVISGTGKTCTEKYEEAWKECNDDYNGKCHYLGPRYKPDC